MYDRHFLHDLDVSGNPTNNNYLYDERRNIAKKIPSFESISRFKLYFNSIEL